MRVVLPAAALVLMASASPAWAQWGQERAIHENAPYYPNSPVYHSYAEPDYRNGNWAPPPSWNGSGPAGGMYYGYGYNPGYYSGGYPANSRNFVRYSSDGSYQGNGPRQYPYRAYSGYVPYGNSRGSIANGWR